MKYKNLVEMLELQCLSRGEKKSYVFHDKKGKQRQAMTGLKLLSEVTQFAHSIIRNGEERGVETQGKVIFLQFMSVREFIIAFWATLWVGSIPAPISRKMAKNSRKLASAQAASKATLLIKDSQYEVSRDGDLVELKFTDIAACQGSISPGLTLGYPANNPKGDDCALVQFSSGTTSSPKPIVLTHNNILHNLNRIAQAFEISTCDVGASWLPHYHDMGLVGHILVPMYCGIENHFISPTCFSAKPELWLQLLSETNATISGAPNFAYDHCVDSICNDGGANQGLDLSNWRVAYTGSECISLRTLERFSNQFSKFGFSSDNWYPCYGMAESTLMVTARRGIQTCRISTPFVGEITSVGKVDPSEVFVQQDDGSRSQDLKLGQIVIHSPSVTGFPCAGPINTGDVGFISDGELYIVGRQLNVDKYHGEKVYLDEIEKVLVEKLSDIGAKRCLMVKPDLSQRCYVLLIESKWKIPISNESRLYDLVVPVIAKYLGETQFEIRNVARGKLITTSSGKPDRVRNRQLYMLGK